LFFFFFVEKLLLLLLFSFQFIIMFRNSPTLLFSSSHSCLSFLVLSVYIYLRLPEVYGFENVGMQLFSFMSPFQLVVVPVDCSDP
jgi:hypothetical protein